MCSDGLTDMMNDAQIASTLRRRLALSVMANHLVDQANDNGGRDNIAVLLTQVASHVEKRGLISRWLGK
jgi:protein phosphatase